MRGFGIKKKVMVAGSTSLQRCAIKLLSDLRLLPLARKLQENQHDAVFAYDPGPNSRR